MAKLNVFNFTTLNGFYKGPDDDTSWAHDNPDNEYAAESLSPGGILLFGRVTYELMVKYWPTPAALKDAPAVAEGMNSAEKIVFSRTLDRAVWNRTRIVRDHIEDEVRKLKTAGKDMTILGSGSIVNQLAQQGLIDEYQIMVHPVALGDGTPFLKGAKQKLKLKLFTTRAFKNGNVLLCYRPA
jgi:dihydrofolate reductase